jgi:hypothetical protein
MMLSKLSAPNLKNYYPFSRTVELVVGLANTIYLLHAENIALNSNMLNCINIFDDLVKATGLSRPNEYKSILYALAAHLTFNRESFSFIEAEKMIAQQ